MCEDIFKSNAIIGIVKEQQITQKHEAFSLLTQNGTNNVGGSNTGYRNLSSVLTYIIFYFQQVMSAYFNPYRRNFEDDQPINVWENEKNQQADDVN